MFQASFIPHFTDEEVDSEGLTQVTDLGTEESGFGSGSLCFLLHRYI